MYMPVNLAGCLEPSGALTEEQTAVLIGGKLFGDKDSFLHTG